MEELFVRLMVVMEGGGLPHLTCLDVTHCYGLSQGGVLLLLAEAAGEAGARGGGARARGEVGGEGHRGV